MASEPIPSPNLSIPPGQVAVKVSAIDSTLWLSAIETKYLYDGPSYGRLKTGCWSLFVEHPSGRKLLYDLGTRKDTENFPPACGIQQFLDDGTLEELRVEKNVSEILEQGGVDLREIEAIIWSHFHWDHTGDVRTFPKTTKLIMGEGGKDAFMPGFPVDPKAHTSETDFEGREVWEVPFSSQTGVVKIGDFRAWDYFGDGSFFFLDTPGHAIGHVNALARTNVEPPEFVHLCGDSAHHCGEIRPSVYVPLPDGVEPSPVPQLHATVCPGGIFHDLLRKNSRQEHILELIDPGKGKYEKQKYAMIYDEDDLKKTIRKVEGFDANEDVFTVLAHDWTLKGIIDEWPQSLNGWSKKGWKKDTWWRFLGDFFDEKGQRR